MSKTLLSVVMLIVLGACQEHTTEEVLISEIVENYDSLDSILAQDHVTNYFYNSSQKELRTDLIHYLKPFSQGYTLVESGWLLDRRYYSEYSDSLNQLFREYRIRQQEDEFNEFVFEFRKTESSWELIYMFPSSHGKLMSN